MKEIITLLVLITGMNYVKGDDTAVNMITFGGRAESEYFRGEVLPGGVDTQQQRPDGSWGFSARYMLSGVDANGDSCRVFVANEVLPTTSAGESEPSIVTDSPLLSRLAKNGLTGRIESSESGLYIHIFAKEGEK